MVMGWSVTVNNVQDYSKFDEVTKQYLKEQHAEYADDAGIALNMAKQAMLNSAVLSGGRTPQMYPPFDEHIIISVSGFRDSTDFQQTMKEIVTAGPDVDADKVAAENFHNRLTESDEDDGSPYA
jgi:hypothetical protein